MTHKKSADTLAKIKPFFDIRKYAPAQDMDWAQWARQIAFRVLHLRYLKKSYETIKQEKEASENTHETEIMNTEMQQLADNPLQAWNYGVGNRYGQLRHLPYTQPTVWPLTFFDVSELHAVKQERGIVGAFQDQMEVCDEWSGDPQHVGRHLGHLVIDLLATDTQIKDDFARWLKAYREAIALPAVKPLDTGKRQHWVKHMVLPYFDLQLLTRWHLIRLTDDIAIEILDPEGNRGDPGSFIKTLKKNMKDAISMDTAFAVAAERAQEIKRREQFR